MDKLVRSNTNRKIFGVCGGIAEFMDVDPTIVRVFTAVATIIFPGLLLCYLLAGIIIPKE